jgi:hypothetical protein
MFINQRIAQHKYQKKQQKLPTIKNHGVIAVISQTLPNLVHHGLVH